jgi:hypothetical protein
MKNLLCAVAAFGAISFVSQSVSAADLGEYEERETYIERPARIIERERIVELRYYEPRYYDDEPEVYYVPRRRTFRYYTAGYPYHYRHRFYDRRHYYRRGHERW